MKYYIYTLIFIFSSHLLYSEDINRILITDFKQKPIGNDVYILEDTNNQYTLETIQNHIQEFKKSEKNIPNFGYTNSAFWLLAKLINKTQQKEKILLELYYPLLDQVDFYLYKNDQLLKKIHTGDRRNFYNREMLHKNYIFILEMEPATEYTIFFRIQSEGSVQIPLRLFLIINL